MSIFSNVRIYEEGWSLKDSQKFSDEEINSVDHAEIVPSTYGSSVCFFMVSGGKAFIPLSRDSKGGIGEVVNLKDVKVLTLSKKGEKDIYRIEI